MAGILSKAASQLKLHGHEEVADGLFDHVIFCTNVTYADGGFKGGKRSSTLITRDKFDLDLDLQSNSTPDVTVQTELGATWSSLVPSFPTSNLYVLPSIEHAVRVVRELEKQKDKSMDVLVTGSLLLVGGVIEVAGLSNVAL